MSVLTTIRRFTFRYSCEMSSIDNHNYYVYLSNKDKFVHSGKMKRQMSLSPGELVTNYI